MEANNIEAFGDGTTPLRVDLYQSYGWLSAYSYKDNYPYPSRAAEYYLNLHGTTKKPNKGAHYIDVYRPVYSKKNPSEADFFPGNKNVAPYYMTAQTIPITALQNPRIKDTYSYDTFVEEVAIPVPIVAHETLSENTQQQNTMSFLSMFGAKTCGDSAEFQDPLGSPDVEVDMDQWSKDMQERNNPSEWRHGEFAEDDPFEEYFSNTRRKVHITWLT